MFSYLSSISTYGLLLLCNCVINFVYFIKSEKEKSNKRFTIIIKCIKPLYIYIFSITESEPGVQLIPSGELNLTTSKTKTSETQ